MTGKLILQDGRTAAILDIYFPLIWKKKKDFYKILIGFPDKNKNFLFYDFRRVDFPPCGKSTLDKNITITEQFAGYTLTTQTFQVVAVYRTSCCDPSPCAPDSPASSPPCAWSASAPSWWSAGHPPSLLQEETAAAESQSITVIVIIIITLWLKVWERSLKSIHICNDAETEYKLNKQKNKIAHTKMIKIHETVTGIRVRKLKSNQTLTCWKLVDDNNVSKMVLWMIKVLQRKSAV